ncbi:MAG: nicotinate-nucleotide--dimethylbenzimidazole phosphoribosyltransferase [Bacteroidales bacterium]|uniref:nicotinate-nucleotide--dimethylbenzimidazole phosphoribosyltransferase n=1 Tax=Porphyromonas sp. TaxID=1924944 RepID=UPI0029791107|nr:nicotinate-nucleotide--dimethylbenzimidazole phosphoribosyltransferase [Porphyromonas sp.]MDD7438241.1 nicotinate-nucleotide--dimethylbenzimidazole phosphoribosyltransferase [Bacteroidales bacterium]MDY3067707.1 nicotinate-nucleotide--dimethylbenzimidazole phosphoribosyltransferase [Porphyromonas sp.]
MRQFEIQPLDQALKEEVLRYIDDIAKPKGSLGRLEEIALQVALIQNKLHPTLHKPHHVLFAADHGIEREHVSKSPREVTWQQTLNFKRHGTSIDYLTRQHDIELVIVDSGVDYDIPADLGIVDRKIRKGTSNFLHEAAMTEEECQICIDSGAKQSEIAYHKGCNIISFGEMGIANTSPSAIWMHKLTDIPLSECVGAGSGLYGVEMDHKYKVLAQAVANAPATMDAEEVLRYFGGFEMVMTVGAMLRAAELRMTIIVDGFIMTSCMLMAARFNPTILQYAIFGHKGDEKGHAKLLNYLGAKPLLDLGMKLGEGTGAVTAYPIVKSAVLMMTEMSLFSGENTIEKYF